jgi:hypothetical protein
MEGVLSSKRRKGVMKLKGGMAAATLCLIAASCQSPVTPSLPLNDLLAAPLTVEINGRQFTLETALWRNFMPVVSHLETRLVALVFITAVDGQPFPDDIDATRLWVINGDKVWETTFVREARPRSPTQLDQLEKGADKGPMWDVGTQVEVVVRVTVPGAAPRLLRATKQVIGMVV